MITVGFCTVDRLGPLETNLRDLAKQNLSGLPEVELLIVLNNSPRESHEIVDRFIPDLPFPCRKISEPNQGVNFGRNRIAEEARGEIVVFTDDDLVRDPDWLREMVKAFENPDVSCVGGRIFPRLSDPLPSWFKYPRYDGVIVKYDLGEEPLFVTERYTLPYGASMAFRRNALDRVGSFRTDINSPGGLLGGEETEYLLRLLRSGLGLLYCPKAISYHPIGKERLTKAYMRKRFRDWGTVWARAKYETETTSPRLAGVPRHLYRSMLTHAVEWIAAAVRFDGAGCFLHSNEVVYLREFAREFRRLSADRDRT